MPVIVLTGGPCGGKTTLLEQLRAKDTHAQRWIMVPEAAPLLFRTGLDGRQKAFQKSVVRLQAAMEDACANAARPGQVLLCHRGTLDPLAYWLREGWDEGEFFAVTSTSREEHFRRYAGVLHLQTAAIKAETHYCRWPEAHRPESAAQAAAIDGLCARSWGDHPRYCLLDNSGRGWPEKAAAAHAVLERWLSDAGCPGN